MLARHYSQLKEIYNLIEKAGKDAVAQAKREERQKSREYQEAHAATEAKEQAIRKLEAQIDTEQGRIRRQAIAQSPGQDIEMVGISGAPLLLSRKLMELQDQLEAARSQLSELSEAETRAARAKERASEELARVKGVAEAIKLGLEREAQPYFTLLERAGLLPASMPLKKRAVRSAVGVAGAALAAGATAYAATRDPVAMEALMGSASTALGTAAALSLHPEVYRHLGTPGVVVPAAFASSAVFDAISSGESVSGTTFNSGVVPFLVAMLLIDVLGIPGKDFLLNLCALPSPAKFILSLVVTLGMVFGAVAIGPGLTAGAAPASVMLYPALPFAAAITSKMLAEATFDRSQHGQEPATLPVVAVDALDAKDRVNLENMVRALQGMQNVANRYLHAQGAHLAGAATGESIRVEAYTMIQEHLAGARRTLGVPARLDVVVDVPHPHGVTAGTGFSINAATVAAGVYNGAMAFQGVDAPGGSHSPAPGEGSFSPSPSFGGSHV